MTRYPDLAGTIINWPPRSSVADPYLGSGSFLTPGSAIRDVLKVRIPDEKPGSYFRELKISWVKILNFFGVDPGSGMEKGRKGINVFLVRYCRWIPVASLTVCAVCIRRKVLLQSNEYYCIISNYRIWRYGSSTNWKKHTGAQWFLSPKLNCFFLPIKG
jgi:hypothetical protein